MTQLELPPLRDDKPGTIQLKGHEFLQISYHMPTTCEVCPKPLWHVFRPPPALECKRKWRELIFLLMPVCCIQLNFPLFFLGCRVKVHKEHLDRKEDAIAPCKLHYDPNSAKELLLIAVSADDQKLWVQRLSKKIQKCGYKANTLGSGTLDGSKVSPRLVFLTRLCHF